MMHTLLNWRLTVALIRIYERLTEHRSRRETEHIGAYAGTYLAHGDWDHK